MLRLPSARRPRVSVVVASAKNPARLVGCLAAVAREAAAEVPLEVVVVLDAPEPGLRETLEREVDGARVLHTEVPLGFAGALNLGARHAEGELLHLLHDDAVVGPGWLQPLVEALDENEVAGAAGSLVLNPDRSVQAAGWVLWRDGSMAVPWTGAVPSADSFSPEPFPVDCCSSASLVVRHSVWDTAGGADEALHPAYYVDVDLAMAVRKQGQVVLCAPRSRVCHERGGTRGQRFRAFARARNRALFVAKWADELEFQEQPGTDAAALERARTAARSRAIALASAPRATTALVSKPRGEDRTPRDALLRDIRVKDEYIAHLETIADELTHELELIESTSWWRLRRHLLPAAVAYSRIRELIRRARTSRTE